MSHGDKNCWIREKKVDFLTFLAMKRTMNKARPRPAAAILAVSRLVDARIKAIPQNDEPRSIEPIQQQQQQKIKHFNPSTKTSTVVVVNLYKGDRLCITASR